MLFEDLAPIARSRLLYVPALFTTAWAWTGVLWRGWSAADAVFWLWFELVLASISLVFLGFAWNRHRVGSAKAWALARATIAVMPIILGLASMFTLLAIFAEIGDRSKLLPFVREREEVMLGLAVGVLVIHLLVGHSEQFLQSTRQAIERPWMIRAFAFIGLYLVMIFHHHWMDGDGKALGTREYGQQIAVWLLGMKLAIELWSVWRWPMGDGRDVR